MTGLVLAGGRSSRFGSDKSRAVLHGGTEDMLLWTVSLLASLPETERVTISCRPDQVQKLQSTGIPLISDEASGDPTPLRGLVAALRATGDALLVLPCDLPLMRAEILSVLLRAREQCLNQNIMPGLLRTAFVHTDGHAEPLVAIYETSALPYLEEALCRGRFGVYGSLPAGSSLLVPCPDETAFLNMNTPEERERALSILKKRAS